MEHITKSLTPVALLAAAAVVFVLGTAFLLASDATLSSSLGASSDLAQAGRWIQFLAGAGAMAAVCTAGWEVVVRREWAAGAHLAAMTLDHPSVRAGLAISGIFELGPIRDTYLNAALKLTDEDVTALSPLRLPSVGKPLAITYGTAELPAIVRNSREYHAHRAQSHVPGPLIPVPNANHYTIMEELRSPNGILTRSVMRLMEDTA